MVGSYCEPHNYELRTGFANVLNYANTAMVPGSCEAIKARCSKKPFFVHSHKLALMWCATKYIPVPSDYALASQMANFGCMHAI